MRCPPRFDAFSSRPASRWTRPLGLMRSALPILALLAALHSVAQAQEASAQAAALDPPGRVALLSLAEGAVSLAPADEADSLGNSAWMPAPLNRPLTAGDRLWTGPRARAELHAGSTALRMSEQTSLDLLALDDNVTQLRLAQGSLQLRVRALFDGQRLEVDTPNLAFVVAQPGIYRLDVDLAGDTTRVVAQSGGGTIYGSNGAALALAGAQQGSFSGTTLALAAPGASVQDSFDAWTASRDRLEDQSVAARYLPREIIGYQQLDSYGDWQQNPAYGAVWLPRAVPLNWAPYRTGHWSWIAPWGWTWVDDAPWGFAPFHYGRWAQIGPRWAWVPGRLPARPVYAPALVAFVGSAGSGMNWSFAAGSPGHAPRPGVGWFPLAPGEAFRPVYRASPRYLRQVNPSIVANNTVNPIPNNYRYERQPAAVTALSRDDFARGRLAQARPQALSAADLNNARVLADRAALPQRLPRASPRERPRLAPAALPPAAALAQTVVRSRDERGVPVHAPAAVQPLAAPFPLPPQRNARLEQQAQQRERERHQQELARQQDPQRRQGEEALNRQRAQQEQAQRQQELARLQAQQAQQPRAARQESQRQAHERQGLAEQAQTGPPARERAEAERQRPRGPGQPGQGPRNRDP